MKDNELTEKNEQVDISTINGRTQIVFKKALLKGKVSQGQVLDTLLMAAQLQAEYLVKKLSRGAPLDAAEVKMMKELSEITKLAVETPKIEKIEENSNISEIKSALYLALSEKLQEKS